MSKATFDDINIDLNAYFSKSHISIPFLEFTKIPSQGKKIKEILGLVERKEESSDDTLVVLQTMDKGGLNGGHDLFYISLQVNNLLSSHSCSSSCPQPTFIIHVVLISMSRLGKGSTNVFKVWSP